MYRRPWLVICAPKDGRYTLRRFRKLLFSFRLTLIVNIILDYNVLDKAPLSFRNSIRMPVITTVMYHCLKALANEIKYGVQIIIKNN